jgi:hypothetical protein
MEPVVPQTGSGEPRQVRRMDMTAEDAGGSETDVVQQNQDDIRRSRRGLRLLRPIRNGLIPRSANLARKWGIGLRQAFLRPGNRRHHSYDGQRPKYYGMNCGVFL